MNPIVANILVTAVISVVSLFGAYKYVPLSWVESSPNTFGTSITTINGSDTLSSSRTTINDNFTALNNGKIENSSTTINAVTSLPNLATVGTISSGTWTGGVIASTYGGTGSSTPTSNQVFIGNGASGFKVIGFGISGQFLTSGGNGVAPSWTTGGIDQTLDYNFTGSAFRVKSLIASTTVTFSNSGAGVSYVFPSSQGASSTTLVNNGSGTLSWIPTSRLVATSSPISYTSSSATTTKFSVTLPANTLKLDNIIIIKDYFTDISQSQNNALIYEIQYGSANTSFVISNAGADANVCVAGTSGPVMGSFEIVLGGNGATGSQLVTARLVCDGNYSTTFTPTFSWSTTMAVDSTSDQTLTFNVRTKGNGGNDRYNSTRTYAQIIAK